VNSSTAVWVVSDTGSSRSGDVRVDVWRNRAAAALTGG
jgi:hypothetical protein